MNKTVNPQHIRLENCNILGEDRLQIIFQNVQGLEYRKTLKNLVQFLRSTLYKMDVSFGHSEGITIWNTNKYAGFAESGSEPLVFDDPRSFGLLVNDLLHEWETTENISPPAAHTLDGEAVPRQYSLALWMNIISILKSDRAGQLIPQEWPPQDSFEACFPDQT